MSKKKNPNKCTSFGFTMAETKRNIDDLDKMLNNAFDC